MNIMRSQELCLMPAVCTNCEKLFDVSNDFKKEEEVTEREFSGKNKLLLCWD